MLLLLLRSATAAPAGVTLYWVIYPFASTPPSIAQVKSGWGGTALSSGSEPSPLISGEFTIPVDFPNLTPGTQYRVAFVWSDGTTDVGPQVSPGYFTYANGVCSQSGGMTSKPFGPTDTKVYLKPTGALEAKQMPAVGDRVIQLSSGIYVAS